MHDCVIEAISVEGQNLVLTFEHIDILSNHPMNDTGLNMCTAKARIKFIDYEIKESILYDTSKVEGKRKIIAEEDAQEFKIPISELLVNFEVLKSEELQVSEEFFIQRFDGIASQRYNSDFGYCVIKYQTIVIEWDEFIDKAWFEDR
ncbi:UNVERIFIED_CONTAM: hypothetical protein ABIC26_003629 [Paenibacillus sp. PvR008]